MRLHCLVAVLVTLAVIDVGVGHRYNRHHRYGRYNRHHRYHRYNRSQRIIGECMKSPLVREIVTRFTCPKPDPCATVDCNCNGKCVDGKCQCKTGFEGEFCSAVECTGVPEINSDDMTTQGLFGTVFSFNCNVGFTANGNTGSKICGANAQWQTVTPCEAVECTGVPEINSDDMTTQGIFGDVSSFNCNVGFTANGNTGSKICGANGQWQTVTACKDCYNYTRDQFVESLFAYAPLTPNLNETECEEDCSNDTRCSLVIFSQGCSKYAAPFIFFSNETDFDQCQAKCTQLEECRLFNHWPSSQKCHIFNDTLSNLPYPIDSYSGDTFGEKICL